MFFFLHSSIKFYNTQLEIILSKHKLHRIYCRVDFLFVWAVYIFIDVLTRARGWSSGLYCEVFDSLKNLPSMDFPDMSWLLGLAVNVRILTNGTDFTGFLFAEPTSTTARRTFQLSHFPTDFRSLVAFGTGNFATFSNRSVCTTNG